MSATRDVGRVVGAAHVVGGEGTSAVAVLMPAGAGMLAHQLDLHLEAAAPRAQLIQGGANSRDIFLQDLDQLLNTWDRRSPWIKG